VNEKDKPGYPKTKEFLWKKIVNMSQIGDHVSANMYRDRLTKLNRGDDLK